MSEVIDWINTKIINTGNKININDIDEIRDFTLLWNLFESLCCGKYARIEKIYEIINNKMDFFNINDSVFQQTFQYFYKRYQDEQKLKKLNLSNSLKDFIQNVVDNNDNDKLKKLKFIMIIIYRYRNNLFHGEKDMRYIKFQKENFKIANNFLMYFIEKCKMK